MVYQVYVKRSEVKVLRDVTTVILVARVGEKAVLRESCVGARCHSVRKYKDCFGINMSTQMVPTTVEAINRLFADNLIWLGFLLSVSYRYIKSIPTHEKICAVGKSGPNATFNLIFLGWVGLGLGSSSVSY